MMCKHKIRKRNETNKWEHTKLKEREHKGAHTYNKRQRALVWFLTKRLRPNSCVDVCFWQVFFYLPVMVILWIGDARLFGSLSLSYLSLSLSLSFLNQNYLPCFFFIPSLYISHYFFNCWKKTKSFWADHAKSHQKLFSRSPRGESIFDEHILSCGTI
jgi:hypothetical protein